ncbi:Hypothetical protein ORPV_290 [Orpheovirus IHUMI-LCC2]|uniref:Uncharacterized protein n=1 Tax=Orpheovirus IHUMI-LCC2 TaxID=2023057 RepID=A0A2I2L3T8_9VIRU|nr:Hypothetical protein ORPV_290 [Orpheovirus IHUMI-LCC2]SNW62194.1 Hypothetical protein ORPV_290 [Orpheovirus IHUMI-LCC2]
MDGLPNEIILTIINIILDNCKFINTTHIRYINKNYNNIFMYAINNYKNPIIQLYKYNIYGDNKLLSNIDCDHWLDIGKKWIHGSPDVLIKFLTKEQISDSSKQIICNNFMNGIIYTGFNPNIIQNLIRLSKTYLRITLHTPSVNIVFNNLDNKLNSKIKKSIKVSRYQDYKKYPKYYRYVLTHLYDHILLTTMYKCYPEKMLSMVTSLNYTKFNNIGYNIFFNLLEQNVDVRKLENAAIEYMKLNYNLVYEYIINGIKYKI